MFAVERRAKIHQMVEQDGSVECSELTRLFGVTGETLRKDLINLENDGLLRRTHGGAISIKKSAPMKKLESRMDDSRSQKQSLSRIACNYINEGDIIVVDTGSTAYEFSKAMAGRFENLTVITASNDVFANLSGIPGMNMIMLGGFFNRDENAFYGDLTLDALKNLHAGKAFVFPSAVSVENGLSDYNQEMTLVQKAIIKSADKVYILADSNKFEKNAMLKISEITPEMTVITDPGLKDDIFELYKKHKINIDRG